MEQTADFHKYFLLNLYLYRRRKSSIWYTQTILLWLVLSFPLFIVRFTIFIFVLCYFLYIFFCQFHFVFPIWTNWKCLNTQSVILHAFSTTYTSAKRIDKNHRQSIISLLKLLVWNAYCEQTDNVDARTWKLEGCSSIAKQLDDIVSLLLHVYIIIIDIYHACTRKVNYIFKMSSEIDQKYTFPCVLIENWACICCLWTISRFYGENWLRYHFSETTLSKHFKLTQSRNCTLYVILWKFF